MTLPSSGPLSLADIQTEFGGSNPIGLNEYYAGGSLVPAGTSGTYGAIPSSGQISIQNFYGTTNVFSFNLTSGTDLNLRTQALAAGWNGSIPVIATIPGGNTIQASSTGTYALIINGSFPAGVTLVNNGTIIGRGGNGGNGGNAQGSSAGGNYAAGGATGGTAGPGLLVSVAVSINNIGRIAGGGGGGGGGGGSYSATKGNFRAAGGGGGGGGIGVSSGGAGGVVVATTQGANGTAGGGGTDSTQGTGGAGGATTNAHGGAGGNGGTYGSAGSTGGGGYSGSSGNAGGGVGGGAGTCLSGNSNITWIAFGTRDGAIV